MTQSGDCSDAAPGSGVLRLPETGVPGGPPQIPQAARPRWHRFQTSGLGHRETLRFCCVKHSSSALLQKPQERNSVFKIQLIQPVWECPQGFPGLPWGPAEKERLWDYADWWQTRRFAQNRSTSLDRSPFGMWSVLRESSSTGSGEKGWEYRQEDVCSDLPRRTTEGYWSISNRFK